MTSATQKPLHVGIMGGGVIGVTTGILLNLHGLKTKIYTEHLLNEIHPFNIGQRPPELASLHAAASIIPHGANHPNQEEILDISQKFFHCLAFSAGCGVRVQRHYELFEKPMDVPDYPKAIKDFTLLPANWEGSLQDKNIPVRAGAPGVWGWHFNTFFAEVPTYLQRLYELYLASGGMFVPGRINDLDEFAAIPADVLINCTGRWATEFFPEDKKNTQVIMGHMIKANIFHVPHDTSNQYFSYNYSPRPEVYNQDVYFYPRSDGWLFGGSRLSGYPDIGEEWRLQDEQISGETFKKPGWEVAVPKPVWELNRELIKDITKVDIADPRYSSTSYVGHRFFRNPIRIEKGEELQGKLLLHNYGHGGAGYTLSWGSAYELLKLIEKEHGNSSFKFKQRTVRRGFTLSLLSLLEDLVKTQHDTRRML